VTKCTGRGGAFLAESAGLVVVEFTEGSFGTGGSKLARFHRMDKTTGNIGTGGSKLARRRVHVGAARCSAT